MSKKVNTTKKQEELDQLKGKYGVSDD